MQIKINDKIYETKDGEMIYDVAKRNGIKIPTLCSMREFNEGLCRICLVECGGKLITSCNTKVQDGMEIVTDSERAEKGRRINLELLWADHAGKCATCKKNRMCELQKIAEEYKIENFHFVPRKEEITNSEELELIKDNWSRVVFEEKNPCISRNSEFCIECRRCINICPEKKFGFNHRAGDVVVGTPYDEILDCSFCGKCVEICPTAALTDKNNFKKIIKDLDNLKKLSVAVVEFGMKEKIFEKIGKISSEKDFKKILFNLGFEKIINLENESFGDEEVLEIKDEFVRKEKINPKNIVIFLISSKIARKSENNGIFDYILSHREIARLIRDKDKIVAGKIKI